MATSESNFTIRVQTIIFGALFAFRIFNAYSVQTFFQPDEYFQALEPAWELAFGSDSGAWITWEWREQLRTSVHPVMFAAAYKIGDIVCRILHFEGAARTTILLAAPQVLQALCAATLDQMTWRSAERIYGRHPATFAAAFLTVASPWQWYCSTRTFSNSLEATLTAFALYSFPWAWFLRPEKDDQAPLSLTRLANVSSDGVRWSYAKHLFRTTPSGLYTALTAAAMAFYFRPTNLVIWAAISLAIIGSNQNFRKAWILIQSAVLVGAVVVALFASTDRLYYGKWTFPPFRFVYFNLVQSLAVFYGQNRVDYYFTEGLPLLLITALPFTAIGLWQSFSYVRVQDSKAYIERQTLFVFAFAIIGTILVLSTIGHKEVRFIFPLLPMLHVLAAKPLVFLFDPFPRPRSRLRQLLLASIIAINVYIAGYVGTTHQRGVVDVIHYLRHRQEALLDASPASAYDTNQLSPNITVGFFMPCHSTPWRSHLVYPHIGAWALTCEPPVNMSVEERAAYLDEADIFYADPGAWILHNMRNVKSISTSTDAGLREATIDKEKEASRRPWPNYLIFFEHLEPTMKQELGNTHYRECKRFFNTHWHDDGRRKGDVVVWCMRR